jgi:hypothetical protein
MFQSRHSPVRRILGILGIVLLVIVVAGGLVLFAFRTQFHVPPPGATYPSPGTALEAQRQDLDYFGKSLALDRSFPPAARALADKRLAELTALQTALSPAKLHALLMQVTALADNGHTRMDPLAEQGSLLAPVRVTRFAEGFYVMRATPAHRDMLGGRLESIDGMPFDAIVAKLETLRGGTQAFRRENAAQYVVVQDLLYGLGIAAKPNASVWTVRLPDGRQVSQTLIAEPSTRNEKLAAGFRWLSAEPSRGRERNWIAYTPVSANAPQTWRDFDDHFRLFAADKSCARVVRIQNIADTDNQKLSPFLSEAEAKLRADPPCAIIVDLRGDPGGDYTETWHFTHALPDFLGPKGRIYVLTDPDTFSAAITTAAFIKQAAGDKASIIGEPVGDRLSFVSEGGRACLPNMKACIYYQTARHDYAHSCADVRKCFWLDWLYPVRVSSLQPDIITPRRFADWKAGRDAAYDRAIALSQSNRDHRF